MIIIIIPAIILFNTIRVCPQTIDSLMHRVPASIYLDLSPLLLAGNISANFEIPWQNHILFRFGLGTGYLSEWEHGTTTSIGSLAMVNFLTTSSAYRFEFGAGGSLNRNNDQGNIEWKIYPAIVFGYRYQEYSGGFVFRTGFGFTFAFGYLLYISFGSSI